MGLGTGAVQLGVAGGERAEERGRAGLGRVQRPVEVGDGATEIAQGQRRETPIQGRFGVRRAEPQRLVAVGDRPLVIAPGGVEVPGAPGEYPGARRGQSQGRLEVGLRSLVMARHRRDGRPVGQHDRVQRLTFEGPMVVGQRPVMVAPLGPDPAPEAEELPVVGGGPEGPLDIRQGPPGVAPKREGQRTPAAEEGVLRIQLDGQVEVGHRPVEVAQVLAARGAMVMGPGLARDAADELVQIGPGPAPLAPPVEGRTAVGVDIRHTGVEPERGVAVGDRAEMVAARHPGVGPRLVRGGDSRIEADRFVEVGQRAAELAQSDQDLPATLERLGRLRVEPDRLVIFGPGPFQVPIGSNRPGRRRHEGPRSPWGRTGSPRGNRPGARSRVANCPKWAQPRSLEPTRGRLDRDRPVPVGDGAVGVAGLHVGVGPRLEDGRVVRTVAEAGGQSDRSPCRPRRGSRRRSTRQGAAPSSPGRPSAAASRGLRPAGREPEAVLPLGGVDVVFPALEEVDPAGPRRGRRSSPAARRG